MPKNIVVMPTLKRTELLALALEKLNRTPLRFKRDLDVHIFVDHGGSLAETEYVRDLYYPAAKIIAQPPHVAAPSGCWNILQSLKAGYESGAWYTFLVEEDVMVYPDFFEWHDAKQKMVGGYVATCGRYLHRYNSQYYTNPGSCLSRPLLEQLVRHINDDFFADRMGYMNRTFGVMEDGSELDDGLIRRVMRQVNARVIYPTRPMVAHQGYHAYQRYYNHLNPGPIGERIERVRQMLAEVNPEDRYCRDFEPYDESRTTPAQL